MDCFVAALLAMTGGRRIAMTPGRGEANPHHFSKIIIFYIICFMATQHKEIDAQTLENLLYLSRLSPESTNMETLK